MTMHPELISTVEVQAAIYPSLKGKGVLITGGGSGIGASLVEYFCNQGCRVGFIEVNAAAAEATANALEGRAGHRPAFVVADLRDIEALREAVAVLTDEIGRSVC